MGVQKDAVDARPGAAVQGGARQVADHVHIVAADLAALVDLEVALTFAGVLPVRQPQVGPIVVLNAQAEGASVEIPAPSRRQDEFLAIGHFRQNVIRLELEAVELLPHEHIDHPGHRIRAIDRGGPVVQQLHPVDHDGRDAVQVRRRGSAAHPGRGHAPAVDQQQGARRVQPAQVDVGGAGAVVQHEGVEGVVDLHPAGGGAVLNQPGGVHGAQFPGAGAHDDLHWRYGVELVAPDAGAGDHHFLKQRVVFVCFGGQHGRGAGASHYFVFHFQGAGSCRFFGEPSDGADCAEANRQRQQRWLQ